ncbi:MAG: hypothetical protein RLZZ67_678 [Candidatus Parcubacteria bacterium]|jgi:hypothetical protein
MKKILPLLVLAALIFPVLGHAQNPPAGQQNSTVGPQQNSTVSQGSQPVMATLQNPLKVSSLGDLYKSILKIVVEIGYVLVALFLLLAGFKFVTAQGSESKLEDAKKTFYYTIIGALIVIGAQTIFAILRGVISGLTK